MSPGERLLLLAIAAFLLSAFIAVLVFRLRMSPAENERRRRIRLNLLGRMTDGMLTGVEGATLQYTYMVQGVSYSTAQDVGHLRDLVPADASLIIGPVTLKYLVRNPANSIVVCEHWSGLRIRPGVSSRGAGLAGHAG